MKPQHSEAYKKFINQVNTEGYAKANSYYDPDLFCKIYDYEREEVEETLIELYNKRDWRGIELMPYLITIDGVAILKNKLQELPNCSLAKAEFANALHKATGDTCYENILFENLQITNKTHRNIVLMNLLRNNPTQRLFTTCIELCKHDSSELVRFWAAVGLLYCAGVVKDFMNFDENYRYLVNGLASPDEKEKNKAFSEFKSLNKSNFC